MERFSEVKRRMDNQIKAYHDRTRFWLDKTWRTPKEKELEKEVERLTAQLKGLSAFVDIPCCFCGGPMNNWGACREEVVNMFKKYGWHHGNCKPRH